MKRTLALLVFACAGLWAAEPVRIVFDTDMGNDVDDAIALATLHALETRGEVKILAVTITKDNRWAAPFVDLMNTFYGRPGIPIGIVKGGVMKEDGSYTRPVAEKKRQGGGLLYPRRATPETAVGDAVPLLRKTLAAQPDRSVVIVQVGFSTNLSRLLDTPGDAVSPLNGRDLVERKVKRAVLMAGRFSDQETEYNITCDIPSAKKLFAEWPVELVTSGFEIGQATPYPAGRLASDFRYAQNHPLADAYRAYQKMPYNEPLWDPTAVLYAARPESGYFGLSPAGRIVVDDKGRTLFSEASGGLERYLTVDDTQRARVVEAIAQLMSEPPQRCR
jgi:inosine-uridine nucleoside N-ribohydrolase